MRGALLALSLVAGGCARAEPGLVVFAAASLRDPFEAVAQQFAAQPGRAMPAYNFAGSNTLALQLAQGAAADVYASADERWMSYARDTARIVESPIEFARTRMVVITSAAPGSEVSALGDLARSGVRVVLAADAVPAGAYAQLVLDRLAAMPGMRPDFARRVQDNVVSRELDVKAAVAKVRLGEADAAIAYRSDAAGAAELGVIEIPGEYNVVARYYIAVVRDARNAAAARAFIEHLTSPAGQALLARFGFAPVRSGS